jgi:IrrE N-terminal-like domain
VTGLSAAERLLQSLGIDSPADIDLHAIAWSLGVIDIKECHIEGCEARIVGRGNQAIISVKQGGNRHRRRFSICHELGHWHFHRGQTLYCKAADIRDRDVSQAKEKVANGFASDLLLPPYLLSPVVRDLKVIDVTAIRKLAKIFDASMSATAIKLIKSGFVVGMIVCHGPAGKQWHMPSPQVPSTWFPKVELDESSPAFDMLFSSCQDQPTAKRVGAHLWFERSDAARFQITEQSFKVAERQVLTLLTFGDREMLD